MSNDESLKDVGNIKDSLTKDLTLHNAHRDSSHHDHKYYADYVGV